MKLSEDISSLKGIGSKKKELLQEMNILTLGDLLNFFPTSYIYRGNLREVSLCVNNEKILAKATLSSNLRVVHFSGKTAMLKATFSQGDKQFNAVFYSKAFIMRAFSTGDECLLYGVVKDTNGKKELYVSSFEKVREDGNNYLREGLQAVYTLGRDKFSQKEFTRLVKKGLLVCECEETLPPTARLTTSLISREDAYRYIHFPSQIADYEMARERFLTEDFLERVVSSTINKQKEEKAIFTFSPSKEQKDKFFLALSFSPTKDQLKAMEKIEKAVASGIVSNTLLQGDVGCGKSVVAYYAMYLTYLAGMKSLFVLPTKLLASQQFAKLRELFAKLGMRTILLSGANNKKENDAAKEAATFGEAIVIVATHSAFSKGTAFEGLGFIVCDEQHRFGVEQRSALKEKSPFSHMLVMSATPIPRTLSLVLYRDLDVINIYDKPKGKKEIATRLRSYSDFEKIKDFILCEAKEHHSIYMVVPSIDSPDMPSIDSVSSLVEERMPSLKYRTLSSQNESEEAAKTMEDFANGKFPLLISTTVVEVGVDNPFATVIVIFGAERFGLSQLHQLRGRVGRSNLKSYCILLSDSSSQTAQERLGSLERISDGFEIAKKDLALRGAGERLGTSQHGESEYFSYDISESFDLYMKAGEIAKKIIASKDKEDILYIESIATKREDKNVVMN